jgi:hypothetical protein
MLLKRVQSTIIFRDFLAVADRNTLAGCAPQEILDLLKSFNRAALEEIAVRPTFGTKRFEGAILKIWELSKKQAAYSSKLADTTELTAWRQVMANCNAVYESILFFREKFGNQTAIKRVA